MNLNYLNAAFSVISSADKVGKTILLYKSFYEISSCAILIRFWFEICVRFQLGFPGNVSDS
jgi:hypothetical protein